MDISELKLVLESILLVNKEPVSIERFIKLFPEESQPSVKSVEAALAALESDLADRSFELRQVASGYRLQVKQAYAPWVQTLWEEKPPKYSRAILETLALIAYQQPITRAEIEEVRGVSVSAPMIKTLLDREWIKVVGHRDVPGRPALFSTTKQFLDYFNLESLRDLPEIEEPAPIDTQQIEEKMARQLELDIEPLSTETIEETTLTLREDLSDEDLNDEASIETPEEQDIDFSDIEAILAKAELAIAGKGEGISSDDQADAEGEGAAEENQIEDESTITQGV